MNVTEKYEGPNDAVPASPSTDAGEISWRQMPLLRSRWPKFILIIAVFFSMRHLAGATNKRTRKSSGPRQFPRRNLRSVAQTTS